MQTTATTTTSGNGGNVFAFLFGAIFNLVANNGSESFLGYTIKVVVYVCIYFLAKILADIFYKNHFEKKSDPFSDKSKKQLKKKRDRHV
jgi:hypothetical protein